MAATVVDVIRRHGEVPAERTDDRRSWLLGLTAEDLRVVTREHGRADDVFSTCWGWGAYGSGLADPADEKTWPACVVCGKATAGPLWFTDGARDWRCAAIAHLTDCDLWT